MSVPISWPAARAGQMVARALWLALAGVAAVALAPFGAALRVGPALPVTLLTLFVAAVVASFSGRFLRADPRAGAFFVALALLVAAVLIFAWSGHLVAIAAGWWASGALLARLVGHVGDGGEAQAAARRARRTFLIGDAALAAAFTLLAVASGSARIEGVLAAAPALPPALVTAAALLLGTAAATRCALPPFSGWLLGSLAAPTPTSALMHAGLVNAGGILLLRFASILAASPAAAVAVGALGLAGTVFGIGLALVRPDVKGALAASTVAQMGFMVLCIALGADAAALWHLVTHGLFKAWLFLAAGGAVRVAGSARPQPAGGLAVIALPPLAAGAALALGGPVGAASLTLLLGAAAAAAALAMAVAGGIAAKARLALIAGLVALVAGHAAGAQLAAAALGPTAATLPLAGPALALAAGFLLLGAWQFAQRGRSPLPAPLYVRLVNAGAPSAPRQGDAA